VPYEDKHLDYASHVNTNGSAGTLAFGLFSGWTDMASVDQSRMQNGVVAPTLLFFQPKNIWVLAY
jgi:endo-1,4-beta-xylanase